MIFLILGGLLEGYFSYGVFVFGLMVDFKCVVNLYFVYVILVYWDVLEVLGEWLWEWLICMVECGVDFVG